MSKNINLTYELRKDDYTMFLEIKKLINMITDKKPSNKNKS